jgi:AcrR family transcriptional regulator
VRPVKPPEGKYTGKKEMRERRSPMSAREKIMKAADRLFGEIGFDAASTREIARLSGVNKALIHYHFQSKEGLFVALMDNYYERLEKTLRLTLTQGGSLRENLARTIDAYVDFLSKNRNFSRIVQRESAGGKHMDRVRAHMFPIFEMGRELLQGEYPHTRSGELAAHHLLVSVYGMIVSYFTYSEVIRYLIGKDPLSTQELEGRKGHLHRMIGIIADELDRDEGSGS